MRVVVIFALLTGGMMAFGWPSPWVLVCSAFAAGFLARAPRRTLYRPELGRDPRRPGYMPPPASRNGNPGTVERVATYTGYSTGGLSQEAEARLRMLHERSSDTEPGFSTAGPNDTTATAGRPGNAAPEPPAPAATDTGVDRGDPTRYWPVTWDEEIDLTTDERTP